MYSRLLNPPTNKSFFLFGPRGVGKTSWVQKTFPGARIFDLLHSETYRRLLSEPSRLEQMIPEVFSGWIVIDEIQRVPELLNEVHRLIEKKKYKFILTGSSARKLKRKGVNLLAGRALTLSMHPLTSRELGKDFQLKKALQYGMLPSVWVETYPEAYLDSYIKTYLREEVQEEGLTRNLGAFARFLEAASFSQAASLNISAVARDCSINRKVVEDYFGILEDLLIGVRLPIFSKRAKRKLIQYSKFFFFDVGVFRSLRPRGPLDSDSEIDGPSMETLVFQEIRAMNDYLNLGFSLHFWRTAENQEIDFVLYGEKGLIAVEVKKSSRISGEDLKGLELFRRDYPMARCLMIYGGHQRMVEKKVEILPIKDFFESNWWE